MASFEHLISKSGLFYKLFVGEHGLFPNPESFDRIEAKKLWDDRFPVIEWDFCQHDGCKSLIPEKSKYCIKHGEAPRWQWYLGVLYKYVLKTHKKQDFIYLPYDEVVSKKKYGKKPDGYIEYHLDKNPFNFKPENIVFISKIAFAAIRNNILTYSEAVAMDGLLQDFITLLWSKERSGRRPFVGFYGYGDIAAAAGVKNTAVRSAVCRNRFDPANLSSVLEFVNLCKMRNNPKKS